MVTPPARREGDIPAEASVWLWLRAKEGNPNSLCSYGGFRALLLDAQAAWKWAVMVWQIATGPLVSMNAL